MEEKDTGKREKNDGISLWREKILGTERKQKDQNSHWGEKILGREKAKRLE